MQGSSANSFVSSHILGVMFMKKLTVNQIRDLFLDFFGEKGHLKMPSFSLVPDGDNSLLLINSGMAPLKAYFTGQEAPPCKRVVTCQKCIRTIDIEEVGKDARHGSFFEMLGNFSFGDYFKSESIAWSWEFLTKILEISEHLLFPSVYIEDNEAFDIWTKEIGLPPSRVSKLGKEDNFWEIEGGSGPCGPCSEIYFDRGEENGCDNPDCAPGCDCDRFIEVWNNVFTQFNSDGKGSYAPLEQKNIDTGMGLERLAMVCQQVNSVFEVDTIRAIIDRICEISDVKYNADANIDISIRIIADHIRSAVFMTGDTIVPSNEGRGYVLRRILRRAARHGKLIGIKTAFLHELADIVIELSKAAYPELGQKRDYIKKVIKAEEDRFQSTIDTGLEKLNDMIDKAKSQNLKSLAGADVFKLYDTFGFPYDLTLEICAERAIAIDDASKAEFDALMTEQSDRARKARAEGGGWGSDKMTKLAKLLKNLENTGDTKTEFTGYVGMTDSAQILAIILDNGSDSDDCLTAVDSISGIDNEFILILDKTPFYAESGGQIGDTGIIHSKDDSGNGAAVSVVDCKRTPEGTIAHMCCLESGELRIGERVDTRIHSAVRRAITRNHTVAHLLHAALRHDLGEHIEQAGSYVDAERLRFDFTHFAALTSEELHHVELVVNDMILSGLEVSANVTDMESAKKMGAIALFGEKYENKVRVVRIGDFSVELCGGTHLDNTAKAGLFKIVSESSVAAGVRRIEGVAGWGVIDMIDKDKTLIANTAKILKANNPNEIDKKSEALQIELKEARREIDKLRVRMAGQRADSLLSSVKSINSVNLVTAKFDDLNAEGAKVLCEELRTRDANIVAVIAATDGGKLTFTSMCGAEAIKNGANAGAIVKQVAAVAGGGGGGKPDFAVAGGRDLTKVDEALAICEQIV